MPKSTESPAALDDAQRAWLKKMGATLKAPVGKSTTTTAQDAVRGQDPVRPNGKAAPGGSSKPAASGSQAILKEGAAGPDVEEVQRQLIEQGASIKADGKFGPLTTKAVKEFQTKKGLTADGVIGPKTRAALSEGPPKPEPPDTKPRRVVVLVTDAATNDAVEDASVKIADQSEKTGNTGQATFSLPPGTHSFGVTAEGFEQEIGTFEVTSDDESELRVELKAGERPTKTVLSVKPSGKSNKEDKLELTANVTVGGKPAKSGTVRFDVVLNETTRQTLATVPVKDGKAVHVETKLTKGNHLLDATFKPDTGPFEISQSEPVKHEIVQTEKGEDREVAKRIVDKLNDDDGEGMERELEDLRRRGMRRLLNIMVLVQKAGKMEVFLTGLRSDNPENDRIAVAAFTAQRQYTRQWFKMFQKLSELDRKAILARTPQQVIAEYELENDPTDPPDPNAEPDDPNAKLVIDKALSAKANIEFHSKAFGGLGSTEFEVKIGPNGKMKSAEIDMTLIKANLKKVSGLGPVLDLEGKLSINGEVEFKEHERVIVKEVEGTVKAEIQLKFPEIKVLKNVKFTLAVKFDHEGKHHVEAFISIPIPEL